MFRTVATPVVGAIAAFGLAVSASAQGVTGYKQGKGNTVVTGAARTNGSTGDKGLEHCDTPMAAMAVVEPQSEYMMALSRYNLQSPVSLIRMMIQQSNGFIVVERGQGFRNMQQERDLASGRHAGLAGSVVSGLQFKEAQTSMLVADARSGVQVASAEGSTKKADLNPGGSLAAAKGAQRERGEVTLPEQPLLASRVRVHATVCNP